MTRPAIEVADIVRRKGRQFLQRFKAVLSYQQLKAYRAVERCRTAALGGLRISVSTVRTKHPSRTTPVVRGVVQNVRHKPASAGSRRPTVCQMKPDPGGLRWLS